MTGGMTMTPQSKQQYALTMIFLNVLRNLMRNFKKEWKNPVVGVLVSSIFLMIPTIVIEYQERQYYSDFI